MTKVSILGAGTWGMALARVFANNGHKVTVWSALESEIDVLVKEHKHPNLPMMEIPDSIIYTKAIEEALDDEEVVLFAVSSPYIRSTANKAAPYLHDGQLIVNVAKGIELETLSVLTDVIKDELYKEGNLTNLKFAVLSGPTHAEEVACDMPTAIVSTCNDIKAAEFLQELTVNQKMAVYTNTDVVGVEICGALKNIIALAAGTIRGLGYGDNLMAALITRGMDEISRLGVAMCCDRRTFFGLAGIGDLIVTAMSEHSRNNKCGQLVGQGKTLDEAKAEVGMVVEGINALPAAMALASKYNVDMPIVSAVNDVFMNGKNPRDAARDLMILEKGLEFSF